MQNRWVIVEESQGELGNSRSVNGFIHPTMLQDMTTGGRGEVGGGGRLLTRLAYSYWWMSWVRMNLWCL